MKEDVVPEVEKVELDGRIIDEIYEVVKAFGSLKDMDGVFVGIVRHKIDRCLYVIKAMGGSKSESLSYEAANNEYLSRASRFTVKMILFKPA